MESGAGGRHFEETAPGVRAWDATTPGAVYGLESGAVRVFTVFAVAGMSDDAEGVSLVWRYKSAPKARWRVTASARASLRLRRSLRSAM